MARSGSHSRILTAREHQGEALATWALWAVVIVVVLLTSPVWLLVVALAVATTRVLLSEDRRAAYSPA